MHATHVQKDFGNIIPMPTYEYACRACRHEFEEYQSITAPVKRKCPKCGKSKLERLIGTGAGIIFKGSGFYETDYRSESYKKAAEADKKSSEPKTQKADAKADTSNKGDAKEAPASSKSPASEGAKPARRSKRSSRR